LEKNYDLNFLRLEKLRSRFLRTNPANLKIVIRKPQEIHNNLFALNLYPENWDD
jgi:hypothetical protein